MKPGILAIDIGGTALKVAVIDDHGRLLSERLRTPTPRPCTPLQMIDELAALARSSIRASLAAESTQRQLLAQVDAWLAAPAPGADGAGEP